MKFIRSAFRVLPALPALLFALAVVAQEKPDAKLLRYEGWKHSGSIFLLTTPEGANIPASALEKNVPVLLRLHQDCFRFGEARANGEDIRFSTPAGAPLAYQIEEWDAAKGTASIWVRVLTLEGNARQEISMHWGNTDAAGESSGQAVFNESNGYLSVWHMNGQVGDEVKTVESKDTGTTACPGIIGQARHFAGKQGIFCGDKIADYPTGGGSHSTGAWFKAEKPNTTILGWGNEGGGRGSKVRMQFRSPPHLHVDSDFADVNGESTLPTSEWVHVVHTYGNDVGTLYINGRLDGSAKTTLGIKSPSRLWIGGWYDNYDFVGDIDEVRISKVTRSANWVKLEYENQKPMQTLAGPLVQPGDAFSVLPATATVNEGKSVTFTAQAGGAQKIYWILKRDGRDTIVAMDRMTFTFDAGRVTNDQSVVLQIKAVCANEVKILDIPITIREAIPDPVFTLQAPATWDGRARIEIEPKFSNGSEMQAAGAGDLHYLWAISDIAVTHETVPGKLTLTRAQNSGKMTVTATLNNGGKPVTQSAEIIVTEPAGDPWSNRISAKDEKPEENQFYARDDQNEGTLFYNGTLNDAADSVFLKVYADERPYKTESRKLAADGAYAFAVKLRPGLIRYKVEFGSKTGPREMILNTVGNLICGDAYLINGQSNAEATSWGDEEYRFTSPWIRSYGSTEGSPPGARLKLWENATARGPGGKTQIGYWGMELARQLVENQKIPICIINGAVGGTRIDQHQRNPADPEDVTTIYGRLLWRVRQAGLTHGIRGILWHQGENDQGADGPTGGFGYQTYRQYFIDMACAWKQDYPNIQHYYLFQIWPRSCAMGALGSDNRLREVQRTLPTAFSHMSVMSTLGIDPPGGCHFPPAGYAALARLIRPLVERDNHAKQFKTSITAPNLKTARYANDKHDEIVMEFDQPMKWNDALASQFTLDGEGDTIRSGAVSGNHITLKRSAISTAHTLAYLDGKSWSQSTLLRGVNGIAALTFCDVPILSAPGAVKRSALPIEEDAVIADVPSSKDLRSSEQTP